MLIPEPLGTEHQLSTFTCGEPALDHWLINEGLAAQKKGTGRAFVLTEEAEPTRTVLAYYTLSAHVIERDGLSRRLGRGMPAQLPAALLGKRATHTCGQGQGLGGQVLAEAVAPPGSAPERAGRLPLPRRRRPARRGCRLLRALRLHPRAHPPSAAPGPASNRRPFELTGLLVLIRTCADGGHARRGLDERRAGRSLEGGDLTAQMLLVGDGQVPTPVDLRVREWSPARCPKSSSVGACSSTVVAQ